MLNDAYTRGLPHPDVAVAELVAYSEFDAPGATLDDVAKKLSSERAVSRRRRCSSGPGRARSRRSNGAYDGLDARGRALAIDVAASHEQCEEAAPLLARGLCEPSGEAPRKAREKLERCKGAAPACSRDGCATIASSRACVAPTLAVIAGADALEPIADALAATGDADATRARRAPRSRSPQALEGGAAGRLARPRSATRAAAPPRASR